jgi:hypothetical protein
MQTIKNFFGVFGAGLVGLVLAGNGICLAPRAAAQQAPAQACRTASESPLVCNVGAYTDAQAKRKEEVTKKMWASLQDYRELPEGYAFRFPADADCVATVAEWMALERMCCPFFSFNLKLEREGGPLWLELTGREGVKQFIESDLPRVTSGLRTAGYGLREK